MSLEVPGGSLRGPWKSLKVPRGFSSGSLKVSGGSLEVPGVSLEGPWGNPGGPWRSPGGSLGCPSRSRKVPWGLPDTNLVQSVQFSCSLEGPLGVPGGTRCSIFRVPVIQTLFSQFSSVVQNTTGAESGAKSKLPAAKSPSSPFFWEPRGQLPGSR